MGSTIAGTVPEGALPTTGCTTAGVTPEGALPTTGCTTAGATGGAGSLEGAAVGPSARAGGGTQTRGAGARRGGAPVEPRHRAGEGTQTRVAVANAPMNFQAPRISGLTIQRPS